MLTRSLLVLAMHLIFFFLLDLLPALVSDYPFIPLTGPNIRPVFFSSAVLPGTYFLVLGLYDSL